MTLPKLGYSCTKIGSGKTPLGGSEVYVTDGVTFLRSQNVHNDGLRLEDVVKIDPAVDAEMAMSRVKPGDVLFNITGASIGRCCLVPETLGPANVNQHVCIIRPSDSRYGRYIAYALQSPEVQSQISASLTGAARDGVTFEQISNLRLPLWDPEAAWRIGTYLDRETADIDNLIGKQEQLIVLLAEKRQAIITHAVTKGLDPTAPTKPSGIPWVGEVPAHWRPSQLGTWLVYKIEGGYSPTASNVFPEEEDWGVLSLGAVGRGEFFRDSVKAIDPSADVPAYLEIRDGDLLLTRSNVRERVGFAAVVDRPRPQTIFPDLVYRLALDSSMDKQYLACFLSSTPARAQIESSARGSSGTMPKISHDQIRAWRIPLPPLSEQHELAEFIRLECGNIDKVSISASAAIELLRERKSALISAAVTGKINVREGAA